MVNVGHPVGEGDVFLVPQIADIIKPHQVREEEGKGKKREGGRKGKGKEGEEGRREEGKREGGRRGKGKGKEEEEGGGEEGRGGGRENGAVILRSGRRKGEGATA